MCLTIRHNWYSEEWNERVTPRNALANIRIAYVVLNAYVISSVKSAETYRNIQKYIESCPEVDGVGHRPGVYKIPMVRMCLNALTNS